MKKYAVAFISLVDSNGLSIEVVEAVDWSHAISKHSKIIDESWEVESLEDAKR